MEQATEVYTIGHSTLSYESFLSLLRGAGVNAVADVRSSPYSRHFPHFNREGLLGELKTDGIAYVFLGDELGGRPKERHFFCDGVADYEKMATTPSFREGIRRVIKGSRQYRIALMCSEHNPLDCHRCLLVGRALKAEQVAVRHILSNGEQRTQADIEAELLSMAGRSEGDMFASLEDRLAVAYRERSRRVAFSASGSTHATAAE